MSILSLPKLPNWTILLIFSLAGLLILSVYNGCQRKKIITSERARANYNDSINKENKRQYDGVREYQSGIIALRDNQLAASNDSLDVLNDKIAALLKRHKSVTPAVDTNVTTVPNEYIADCTDCFDLLDKSKELSLKLRAEQDNSAYAYKQKIKTQDNRITQLGFENTQLKNNLNDAIDRAEKNLKAIEPRRKVLFSINAIAINATYPTGLGAGLIYQDKFNRLYGGHVFGTNVGPVYMAQFALPLSLKRK